MDITQLIEAGGFITDSLVEKEVTWERKSADGNDDNLTFKVRIKRQPFGALERIATMDQDKSKAAQIISDCVRFGDDGKQIMSYDKAYHLHPGLAAALLTAVNEVNAGTKNSPPPMKSGTN